MNISANSQPSRARSCPPDRLGTRISKSRVSCPALFVVDPVAAASLAWVHSACACGIGPPGVDSPTGSRSFSSANPLFSLTPTADCPRSTADFYPRYRARPYPPPIALAGAWSGPGTREGRRCPDRSRDGGAARLGVGQGPGHVVDQSRRRGESRPPSHDLGERHRRMRRRRARVLSQASFLRAGRGKSASASRPCQAGSRWRVDAELVCPYCLSTRFAKSATASTSPSVRTASASP